MCLQDLDLVRLWTGSMSGTAVLHRGHVFTTQPSRTLKRAARHGDACIYNVLDNVLSVGNNCAAMDALCER